MHRVRRSNDSVHWFMNELTSRIVAASGRPADRFHLGKIILQSLKDAPDFALQIDGGTDEIETSWSVLQRTVRCARAMKNFGLRCGDVIVLMAPNHIDLCIPFYAALYLGVGIAAVDATFTMDELKSALNIDRLKIIFCQSDKASEVRQSLNMVQRVAEIITFDRDDCLVSFLQFISQCDINDSVEDFEASEFDPEDTLALLIATSGTTGTPKAAVVTHKTIVISGPYLWSRFTKFPGPTKMMLVLSPFQWVTGIIHFTINPIMRYTRLQSSLTITPDHVCRLINTYRPTFTITSPTFMTGLLRCSNGERCDFCFDLIVLGGNAVPGELIQEVKKASPDTEVVIGYGMTETTVYAFASDESPSGSCGRPMGCLQYRIIDVTSEKDITEPNVPGELWVKGPGVFKSYYNNYEATEDAFSEDHWFKTGDVFYRDENWNFFYVDRIKSLLICKGYRVSPVEIEDVIRRLPGVADVAVTSVPSPIGDSPVACVVRRPGCRITAQDVKDFVKNLLSDAKQLRGGVIFLDEIPMTTTTKVHRRKLAQIALEMEKE